MAREGTRSQTGNSKPRVFPTVDTAPAVRRTTKPKTTKKAATAPTGVSKKKAPKKESTTAKKVKAVVKAPVKKAEKAAAKEPKAEAKPKTAKKAAAAK